MSHQVTKFFEIPMPCDANYLIQINNGLADDYQICGVFCRSTTQETINILKFDRFWETLCHYIPKLKALKFKINEILDKDLVKEFISSSQLNNLPYLLSFESRTNERIICWINLDDKINGLYLTSSNASEEVIKLLFYFIIESLHNGLNVFIDGNRQCQLANIKNSRYWNLLLTSIKIPNHSVFDELISGAFDVYHKTTDGQLPIDIAWKIKNFNAIQKLLLANSVYPIGFDENLLTTIDSLAIKNVIEVSEQLHRAINFGDRNAAIQILKGPIKLKHFYNTANVSAVAIAINARRFDFYDFLLRNNCDFGQLEDRAEIMKPLQEFEQRKVLNCHELLSTIPQKHIAFLLGQSLSFYDDQEAQMRQPIIFKIY